MAKKYEMLDKGYYGWVYLDKEDFDNIPSKFLISGCTSEVKYMCAGPAQEEYLQSIGVLTLDWCDWYKVILSEEVV